MDKTGNGVFNPALSSWLYNKGVFRPHGCGKDSYRNPVVLSSEENRYLYDKDFNETAFTLMIIKKRRPLDTGRSK